MIAAKRINGAVRVDLEPITIETKPENKSADNREGLTAIATNGYFASDVILFIDQNLRGIIQEGEKWELHASLRKVSE